ncbi:DUF2970 domain-containing protein [Porticoccaceae bacterium LTM1]|nr:DUF2970 domain-containing protein [Porticoccaceae bacterium LTM1]
MNTESHNDENKPSRWQIVKSALSAGFGVQSEKNRERDFKKGSAKTFIVVGLLLTTAFVLSIIGLVKLVTHLAGN